MVVTTWNHSRENSNAKFKREISLPLNIQHILCGSEAGLHSVESKQGAFVACSVHLPHWWGSKSFPLSDYRLVSQTFYHPILHRTSCCCLSISQNVATDHSVSLNLQVRGLLLRWGEAGAQSSGSEPRTVLNIHLHTTSIKFRMERRMLGSPGMQDLPSCPTGLCESKNKPLTVH